MINKDDYEKNTYDIDELEGSDVKVDPNYYLHIALIKLNNTFDSDIPLKESFQKYRHIVEHIEILAESANLLNEDYTKSLNDFLSSMEYKNDLTHNREIASSKLSRMKLKLLLSKVFKHRLITDTLKV